MANLTEGNNRLPDFHIVAGSYERLLYGIDGHLSRSNGSSESTTAAELIPVYIYPAHISSIKCVAIQPGSRHLATGSTDEHVRLYDLKLRKEIGSLMHHTGSITDIAFFGKTHLFTASEDGTVGIVRTKDWELLDTLTGHKGPIWAIAMHPSGRMLVTVSGDGFLRLWDLTKSNCCAYTMRVKDGPAEKVVWSPSGDHYAILVNKGAIIRVFGTTDGVEVCTIYGYGRLNSVTICNLGERNAARTVVAAGGEDGSIGVWDLVTGEKIARWSSGHNARIKGMDHTTVTGHPINGEDAVSTITSILVTCSTAGGIRVWDLDATIDEIQALPDTSDHHTAMTVSSTPLPPAARQRLSALPAATPLVTYEANCRLTCIKVTGKMPAKKAAGESLRTLESLAMEEEEEEEVERVVGDATREVRSRHGKVTITYEGEEKATDATPTKNKGKLQLKASAQPIKDTKTTEDNIPTGSKRSKEVALGPGERVTVKKNTWTVSKKGMGVQAFRGAGQNKKSR
ncbi:hypothetical protein HDU67_008108 [Dinochytrium kinnereticum]|nr:hypothetical protein HDU67_008108 [Dinochytrium kinnereticum]